MDLKFEAEDQPQRSPQVGGRRPVSLPLLVLLSFACLAAIPVGFFGVCTAEVILQGVLPEYLTLDSFAVFIGVPTVGGLLLSLGIFVLTVWPQWRVYLQSRAWARLQEADRAAQRASANSPRRPPGDSSPRQTS